MKRYFLHSFISALFFFISLPPTFSFFVLFIFFAFVPLFLIEKDLFRRNKSVFWIFPYAYLAFSLFNFLTTFWVEKASPDFGEGLFAVLCNSLFMTITFLLYCITHRWVLKYFSKNRFRIKVIGLFLISVFWIGFELLHMTWDLNWPWLTLGNVFADCPSWIQWYSYTGVLGGTIWVLILNFLFFQTYLNFPFENKLKFKNHLFVLSLFFFPFLLSKIMYYNFSQDGEEINILVAQPNMNPNYSYNYLECKDYFSKLITKNLNDDIDYVVFPESFFPHESYYSNFIDDFLKNYEKTNFIFGVPIKRFNKKYNSAVQINYNYLKTKEQQYHYKSKLVPGPELTPFSSALQPLLDFSGLSLQLGGLDKGDSINVFSSHDGDYLIAPIICYESVFPNHVRKFIKKGAQAIFIITNDGWWGDSKGRVQHNSYARMRAIESRRYVVRSANTGISSIISPRGDFVRQMQSNTEGSFVKKISLFTDKTFYVKYGNILIFLYLASCILVLPKINFKQPKNKNI